MNKKTLRPLGLQALAVAAGLLSLYGCKSTNPHPVTVNVYVDGSDRTPEHLGRELRVVFDCNRLLKDGDQLNVFVFGHSTELIYRGVKFRSRRDLNSTLTPKLFKADPLWQAGTASDLVLEDVSRQAGSVSVLVGDGGFEDHSIAAIHRMHLAIGQLKAKPDSRLVLVGVAPEFRESWEQLLSPLGTDRYAVRGFADASPALGQSLSAARGGLL